MLPGRYRVLFDYLNHFHVFLINFCRAERELPGGAGPLPAPTHEDSQCTHRKGGPKSTFVLLGTPIFRIESFVGDNRFQIDIDINIKSISCQSKSISCETVP